VWKLEKNVGFSLVVTFQWCGDRERHRANDFTNVTLELERKVANVE